ncbi:bifunctional DNA-binding transcriptional regulator/O6-methylguanine-DNA methyltransferase Ada [Fischerella sp. PCC 9605]|uniref:bifunctional DNA-binding transcriptional regulator/O6-methylguanine-DNA methyltransferase Ada n=1 Tax=Fischerella sp. PCC 9605 TaxID=1173024 RepID=UPI00047A7C38|nr:bifunctional DNA-binding transcriptional regulator/O6-methylguanine-DNA methyltransferase Ada [Fischerella sp. PCC 9605]
MNETEFWQAVLDRDTSFDGVFVYAVRSTGIYCRPSCPARKPQREQVVFFLSSLAAQEKGFRPCRRCYPQNPTAPDSQTEMVQRVCAIIEANPTESITLATLSTQVNISPFHLQRTFKRIMGITPKQYIQTRRMQELKTELKSQNRVIDAIYNAGYGSSSSLYECATTQLGMTPRTYQRGGDGMVINYAIANCNLGLLLVAGTERGICMVSLGDSDTLLEKALQQEYPTAKINRCELHQESSHDNLSKWAIALLQYLSGEQPSSHLSTLPIDVQATAFQAKVWQALRQIPAGSTQTYSGVAESIGQPSAVRAVARACATNPVSLVIPCHRVVRSDGSLGGYRWGIERKQFLLAKEAQKD